jgi:uncharacterized protein (DUF1697 family)
MNTYVILFRGINVGGNNILPMKDLKLLLEERGFQNVRTYIQSGNVVLNHEETPGSGVASAIEAKFSFKPHLLVLEKSDFEASVKNNPYAPTEGKMAHLYFCSKPPEPNFERLISLRAPSEKYELKGNVFYLYAPDGIGRSKLAANVESCMRVPTTARNLNTVNKIAQMLE